jgi:hypothetical protein
MDSSGELVGRADLLTILSDGRKHIPAEIETSRSRWIRDFMVVIGIAGVKSALRGES